MSRQRNVFPDAPPGDPAESVPALGFHEGTLRLTGITPRSLERLYGQRAGELWIADDRDGSFRCDAFRYAEVRGPLWERLTPMVRDSIARYDHRAGNATVHRLAADLPHLAADLPPRIHFPKRAGHRLRQDQRRALDAWFAAEGRGVIVMPTGTGKTVVALEAIVRCGCPTLIVVPIRDLMYQWHERLLQATGIDAGIIGDSVYRVSPISVTTYDSAAIHMARIGDRFEMIVFDEVHHLPGPWRSDAARMSAATKRLGLTATLPTDEAKATAIGTLVGPVVYRESIETARGQTLAEYRVRRIAVRLTPAERRRYRELSGVVQAFVAEQRQDNPAFRWENIYALATDDPAARRCLRAFRLKSRLEERSGGKMRVLEDLFRLHQGEPVLVFVGSNVMAREVSLRFLVPCLLSHCRKRERADLLSGLAEGRYPALVANRVLDEGVDLPEVKVAIVLGGTASGRQAIQRLGRVLRKGSGGQAILYEVVTEQTGEVDRSRKRRRNSAYRKSAGPDRE